MDQTQLPLPNNNDPLPAPGLVPLEDPNAVAVDPNAPLPLSQTDQPTDDQPTSYKRGRGRPPGSKNKPNPNPKPRKVRKKKTPPPRLPRGRPPKVRNEEDQAAWEEKRARKALGIKKQKGRPRKFPGYLVREMRLRKNRDEYIHLLREYDETHPEMAEGAAAGGSASGGAAEMLELDDRDRMEGDEEEVRRALDSSQFELGMDPEASGAAGGAEGGEEGGREGQGGMDEVGESLFPQNWDGHGQSLLEVVDAAAAAQEAEARAAQDAQQQAQASGPGGMEGDAVEDMKRVFRLDGDRETIAT